jgi:hypothetical protein
MSAWRPYSNLVSGQLDNFTRAWSVATYPNARKE